jgi:alanyl-tRNA synthetase
MDASELRKKYLEFFRSKGHKVIPGASLIPVNDPTVLFTTAGMHPLVPFILGEKHPAGKRLANVQKCVRTADIDEVGDDVHLTFFEMLGNWSLGDYWKKEAIEWSFEFLTKRLGIPVGKLAVSCFAGDGEVPKDTESAHAWEDLGIPPERVYFFGRQDNWWGPAGETGPCGPDTEMFYWTGNGEPLPLTTGDNKSGWVEIWNDVFMEYNKTSEGKYEPLKQKNVDTGMGVERTIAALNGLDNVYETELFKPLIKKIEEISSQKYEGENSRLFRIISDHLKASTFILAEGIEPSNVERGYVLRRLIRRTVRYGKQLGIKDNFTFKAAQSVMEIYRDVYPEVKEMEDFIKEQLVREEDKFGETLEKGLKELEKLFRIGSIERVISGQKLKTFNRVDAKKAFYIYQTYGFPLEMIQEELAKRLLFVDEEEFNEELQKHQELSRAGSEQKFKGGLADHSEAVIKYHTAAHLMLAALRQVLGPEVFQKGSNMTAERLRFDFSHPEKMTEMEIKEVEDIVNQKIKENLPVKMKEMTLEEAKKEGAMGVFETRYGEQVKVYAIGDHSTDSGKVFSKEICGGPHVQNTGIIGKFKIVKEEASSAGVRRIKAILE